VLGTARESHAEDRARRTAAEALGALDARTGRLLDEAPELGV
jgi:hypothetical protein